MIDAKLIRQVLDKFLKAENVKTARMQVRTLDGVYHDIKSIKLLENKIIGSRETHRIVIEVIPEKAPFFNAFSLIFASSVICLSNVTAYFF